MTQIYIPTWRHEATITYNFSRLERAKLLQMEVEMQNPQIKLKKNKTKKQNKSKYRGNKNINICNKHI